MYALTKGFSHLHGNQKPLAFFYTGGLCVRVSVLHLMKCNLRRQLFFNLLTVYLLISSQSVCEWQIPLTHYCGWGNQWINKYKHCWFLFHRADVKNIFGSVNVCCQSAWRRQFGQQQLLLFTETPIAGQCGLKRIISMAMILTLPITCTHWLYWLYFCFMSWCQTKSVTSNPVE